MERSMDNRRRLTRLQFALNRKLPALASAGLVHGMGMGHGYGAGLCDFV